MRKNEALNLFEVLERYVEAKAPRFTLTNNEEAAFKPLSDTGIYVIWTGASEGTIFSSQRANWTFRAWHESHHVLGELGFGFDDEVKVYESHCREIYRSFDLRTARQLDKVLFEEVVLQAEAYVVDGAFPIDQRSFALAALEGMK